MTHEISLNKEFALYEKDSLPEEAYQQESRNLAQMQQRIATNLHSMSIPESVMPGGRNTLTVSTDDSRITVVGNREIESQFISLQPISEGGTIHSMNFMRVSNDPVFDYVKGQEFRFPEHYPKKYFGMDTNHILILVLKNGKTSRNPVPAVSDLTEPHLESVAFYFGMDGTRSKAHVYLGKEKLEEDVRGSSVEKLDPTHSVVKREITPNDLKVAGMALTRIEKALNELIPQ